MDRRYFLMGSLAAGSALRKSALASPNDTVRVACVGVHGRGRSHIRAYSQMPNVEIAAICDIDESVLNSRIGELEKAKGKRPAAFTDLRKLLEDKSIDAISIATPNHHHTLQTIWACQAGKDVYVEKPCSHDMFEARQIVAAAQKYNRAVQQGTQQRSAIGREAVRQMREGLDRRRLHGPRPVLQTARHHRPQARGGRACRRELRSLAGTRARASIHGQPVSLQLALVLGLRQRRYRQPGHPSGRHGSLGPGRQVSHQGQRHRRPLHVR